MHERMKEKRMKERANKKLKEKTIDRMNARRKK